VAALGGTGLRSSSEDEPPRQLGADDRPTHFPRAGPGALRRSHRRGDFFGNKDLKISQLENDDVRWEWFRKPGEVWAVSWFYKYVKDPIEKVSFSYFGDPYVAAVNYPEGQVSGMEYEARKDLDFLPLPVGKLRVGINYTR